VMLLVYKLTGRGGRSEPVAKAMPEQSLPRTGT
jgi:hypothetical protein